MLSEGQAISDSALLCNAESTHYPLVLLKQRWTHPETAEHQQSILGYNDLLTLLSFVELSAQQNLSQRLYVDSSPFSRFLSLYLFQGFREGLTLTHISPFQH